MSHLRTPRGYGQQNAQLDALGDRTWSLKATYVEIYNEQLRDLLLSDNISERSNVAIREDVKGNIILTGLHQVEINSVEDLLNALNFGSSIRQTDATAINAKSSRSHAVFSLNLVQRKNKSASEKRFSVPVEAMGDVSITTDSKLHFVDLAGSERLKNTGAQGDRAKEGISINAGLAALGKVISQLSSRQAGSHVSYRDSRLTRLLQDSLGGNAITYMIACVTPAEFHLSETLNTVQYAQRARAIQSKPRIQQVEEGDKQAVIDRLKAEVAFLREQIRSADRGPSPRIPQERPERSEREVDLQNQILDIQENYSALSQRHARVISEMAKARESESEHQQLEDSLGDSATDRLNRSNSFAQAVEQVVLEYEKTIQSLEQSLSSTRGTLSNTETNLLEKETKCAYVETINTQLQARLQKLMDREASTENYLHDLEGKLDGHTSGEEKNATIITELRKEIARVRENEASCEDYISTLEERLAEADQDSELMQREIDRLEQVVERQRSLGKLDSLLQELDNFEQEPEPERRKAEHSRSQSHVSLGLEEPIQEVDEEEAKIDTVPEEPEPQSPAQSRFVADKLETVSQELFDLRVEHESTIHEYDALQARYEEAMRHLSELQDTIDEARHPPRARDSILSVTSPSDTRPESFLSDERSSDLKERSSLSRSLSSELSSAMDSDSPASDNTAKPEDLSGLAVSDHMVKSEDLSGLTAELDHLKTVAQEREAAEKALAERYARLEHTHSETLDMVEELKTDLYKARAVEATSPRTGTPVIRRKSSQNLMVTDRAHRSFASLRNLAAENFEDKPEVMQSFELSLNSAMHELHSRSERIQELEADVAAAKKEMETKMTIISGLTRERSSLKASPVDMSMVATLRGQLEQSERQLMETREARDQLEQSERRLLETEEVLREQLEQSERRVTESAQLRDQLASLRSASNERVDSLEKELVAWEDKHQSVLDVLALAESDLRATVQSLEAQLVAANAKLVDQSQDDSKQESLKQENLIAFLRSEIDEYKAIINSNVAKVAELEAAHASARQEIEQHSQDELSRSQELNKSQEELANKLAAAEAEAAAAAKSHEELVAKLAAAEAEVAAAAESREELVAKLAAAEAEVAAIADLKTSHAKELSDLKTHEQKGYEEQVEVLLSEHADAVQRLENELAEAVQREAELLHAREDELSQAREGLVRVASQVAAALGVEPSVEKLTERINTLGQERVKRSEMEKHVAELTSINETIVRDLESAKAALSEMLDNKAQAAAPLAAQLTAVKNRMSDLDSRSKKNSRLVEELEEQLQNNFDEAQMTNNRLSTLQTERNAQFEEINNARIQLQVELDALREEHQALQVSRLVTSLPTAADQQAKMDEGVHRSNSNSTIRKSASHTSLPSPPPAIPLPPLPTPGSPTSGRPPSKDNIAQITEDQEARIRTIEKHLYAERQLTGTLEEALNDLEKQSNKMKADCEAWKKRAQELETEVKELKDRPPEAVHDNRWSLQAVEEERKKRQAAEAARRQLEERMNAINKGKKKKGSLNCF